MPGMTILPEAQAQLSKGSFIMAVDMDREMESRNYGRPTDNRNGGMIALAVAAVAALIVAAFFLLGGDADVDVDSGDVDIEAPAADADVDAPDVDVDPGSVDVDPGSVDVDEADAEAEAD